MARLKNTLFQCEMCFLFKDSGFDHEDPSTSRRLVWCEDCNPDLIHEAGVAYPVSFDYTLACIESVKMKRGARSYSVRLLNVEPVCRCDMRDLLSVGHNVGCEAKR